MSGRGPLTDAHAAAISRGQRERLARLANQPRPVIRRDPIESASCSDRTCPWEAHGMAPEPRQAARAHVRETGHTVHLAWKGSISLEARLPDPVT